jgi:hypothetical protein
MVGEPQGAMRVTSQIWQVVLFGPSQKGTICSSDHCDHLIDCEQ